MKLKIKIIKFFHCYITKISWEYLPISVMILNYSDKRYLVDISKQYKANCKY